MSEHAIIPAAPPSAADPPPLPPSSSSRSGGGRTILLDSLPYVDQFPEDYESYALSLIEREMQGTAPDPNALSHLPPFHPHPSPSLGRLSRIEYDALVARGGGPRPQSERVNFASSSAAREPAGDLSTDEHAWRASVRAAKVDLERERSRAVNLDLQRHFEAGQWRMHNAELEGLSSRLADAAKVQRMEVDRLNAERKEMQEGPSDGGVGGGGGGAAAKLGGLEARFDELVRTNRRLASATFELDKEVKRLRTEVETTEVEKTQGKPED